jgi:hypothetical protein
VKVAARILGTSVRGTYRAIERGEIQAKKIAGRTIVPEREINRLLGEAS